MILKRTIDVTGAALGLLVLSPLFLLIALFLKLDSKGPIFFLQKRIGKNFEPFWLVKFRSMVVNDGSGPQVTASGDPRVTRIGKILRKTKIDELPQLWNVFKGEMSLVGPRPEVPQFVEAYKGTRQNILKMRPGITDWASIVMIDEERILADSPDSVRTYFDKILPEKLKLQGYYVEHRSLWMDVRILFWTIVLIVSRRRGRDIFKVSQEGFKSSFL